MVTNPEGTGQGVSILLEDSLQQRIASVADQVQEWAVEQLWYAGRPATWPECPQHPDGHPLEASVMDEVAVWRCPRSKARIATVGSLELS